MGRDGTGPGPHAPPGARPRPLSGIRVIDVAGPFGAYASRLLADLGATVTRIVPPDGDELARETPRVRVADGHASAFAWFVNLDKELVALDLEEPAGRTELLALLGEADLLIESWGADASGSWDRADLAVRFPRLIVVSVTPFGVEGPRHRDAATDLVAFAAGGLLSLGGYPDREPIATLGQAHLAASIFGAAAAIFGLIARDRDGNGRHLDVAAQEVIAAALEDAIPQFDLTGTVRRRAGDTPREAGTGIYPCLDGYVSMVAGRLGTARAWRSLVAWLVEAGAEGAEVLLEDAWDSFPHRQRTQSVTTFATIFGRFAAQHSKADLYSEAQRRDIALAPVNEVGEVLANEQLRARGFFVPVDIPELGRSVLVPGRPYRLSDDGVFEPHVARVESAAVPRSPVRDGTEPTYAGAPAER
jgi:benzylsuccinate CoA-transferase BbsE subunit